MVEKITIESEVTFNKDKSHRFVWKRVWNKELPLACVITLNPSSSDCFELDLTSMLILNNVYRLGKYGGVCVVNLFSKVTGRLSKVDYDANDDLYAQNMKAIKQAASSCDVVIVAWGKSGESNKRIKSQEEKVLSELSKQESKLMIISDCDGEKGLHPLCPTVRKSWDLQAWRQK